MYIHNYGNISQVTLHVQIMEQSKFENVTATKREMTLKGGISRKLNVFSVIFWFK